MSRVELPWPARELHPNARPHHMAKRRATKAARTAAHWAALSAHLSAPEGDGSIHVTLTFCPPPIKRNRDLDGMAASMKAALDGIADAMKVNDRRFVPVPAWGEPVKGGKVIVEVRG